MANKISESSEKRVKRFIDGFIRSEYVASWTAEKDSDFINEPDRAARCAKAAEYGADGKTHAEVIEDWREAFHAMVRDRERANWRRENSPYLPERFVDAVEQYFGGVEEWHEKNGSLWQEIG